MAVVFISPKKRQKSFFLGITIAVLLFLSAVASFVFLSQPSENQAQLVFNKPKVSVDFKIFDSDQFKNLTPFLEMELQFAYQATTKEGRTAQGMVSAPSIDDARKILEGLNLTILNIQEAKIGRDNPFVPYYQPPAGPSPKPK